MIDLGLERRLKRAEENSTEALTVAHDVRRELNVMRDGTAAWTRSIDGRLSKQDDELKMLRDGGQYLAGLLQQVISSQRVSDVRAEERRAATAEATTAAEKTRASVRFWLPFILGVLIALCGLFAYGLAHVRLQ